MVQTTLKVFFAGIIILVTILFGAVVFFVYYENGFSKPTFFEWVAGICGDLLASGATEAEMDKCRGSATVSFAGIRFMWDVALPLLLAWLSVPLFTGLMLLHKTLKKALVLTFTYLVLVLIFYIFWINF